MQHVQIYAPHLRFISCKNTDAKNRFEDSNTHTQLILFVRILQLSLPVIAKRMVCASGTTLMRPKKLKNTVPLGKPMAKDLIPTPTQTAQEYMAGRSSVTNSADL